MPMNPHLVLIAGAAVLMFAWAGPLPGMVPHGLAAHMWLHMTVVGVGVPLIAVGTANLWQVRLPVWLAVTASLVDFAVIWLWHAPGLHHAARSASHVLALEQASFAGAALLVWLVALQGPRIAGALTLFFTSMHMTLLGALMALAPRPIYHGHAGGAGAAIDPLLDQQIGGIIMLAIGGVIYLAGALGLSALALRLERAQ
jgi:putative membrane protein